MINNIFPKLKTELEAIVGHNDFLCLAYGSSVQGISTSDLDLLLVLHDDNEELRYKIEKTVTDFHVKNNLKLDDEVPHHNKLVYSFDELYSVVKKSPFQAFGANLKITEVEKTEEFLNSAEIRKRLLFNALTTPSYLLVGNESTFEYLQKEAFKTLVKTVLSYTCNLHASKEDLLSYLLKDPYTGNTGEMFLGYKEKDCVTEFLTTKLGNAIKQLLESIELEEVSGKYKMPFNVWQDFLNNAYSNFEEVDLIEYPKMSWHDFSSNSNPLGPSSKLVGNISKMGRYLNIYPDYKNVEINQSIARFLKTNIENTAVCNGSIEAIYALPQLLDSSKPGVIQPTYWAFEAMIEKLGKTCKTFSFDVNKDLKFIENDIEELAKDCSMIYLCNPNNPTSSYIEPERLIKIINKYPNCHFMVDESHILLKDDHLQYSLLSQIDDLNNMKNLSLIFCLSKMFSVGGMRVGALVANKKIIEMFKDWQVPYSLNTFAQAFFPLALEDKKFIQDTRINLDILKNELSEDLASISWLKVIPSRTNFILCEVLNGKIEALDLAKEMKKHGFYLRDLTTSYPGLPGEWIRITVNNKFLNKKLVEKLKCI